MLCASEIAHTLGLADTLTDQQMTCSYYRFILKLGSVPGGNWGERWARWLSDSRELASTSSSARSSPVLDARQLLAESTSGTEYDDEEEQASQSAVGYGLGGSQAGPFSTRSLSPPLRTSTPLARRRPPARPSSVVHPHPRLYEPTPRRLGHEQARMLATSPPPPPHPPPPLPSLQPLPKRISQSRAAIEEELRREDEERARQREDERRADVFYNIGLMGRCWDVWRKGREWVTVRPLAQLKAPLSADTDGPPARSRQRQLRSTRPGPSFSLVRRSLTGARSCSSTSL